MNDSEIDKHKQDIVFETTLCGRRLVLHSTWGLFSPREVDEGSRLLVRRLELAADQSTLELGCGYGAIGLVVASLCPAGRVHMVDKDYVEEFCCGDFEHCIYYRAFEQQKRR